MTMLEQMIPAKAADLLGKWQDDHNITDIHEKALDDLEARTIHAFREIALFALSPLDPPDDALIEAIADAVLDNHYPNSPRDPQMYRIARPIARAALRAAVDHILGRKP